MNSKTLEEIEKRRGKPSRINVYQRLVLFIGAIALVTAIWTSPKVVIWEGIYFIPEVKRDLMPMIEPRTASMRVVEVIGATLLIFFALKGYEPKKNEGKKVDLQETLSKLERKAIVLQQIFYKLWEKEKAERAV